MSSIDSINQRDRQPFVSVLVPHYNDLAGLEQCLESLTAQTYAADDFEVIVADNDTPGGVDALAARFPGVNFLTVRERGAAIARNKAMSAARGEIFAFIDADCVADRQWIEIGVASMNAADYAGGHIEVTYWESGRPSATEAFEKVFGFRQAWYLKRKRFSATANLFVRREVAEAIGPFRNEIAEDLDWGNRADSLGFRLFFNAKQIVNHPARKDWNALVAKWDRLTKERWSGFGQPGLIRRAMWTGLAAATALSAGPHMWTVLTSRKLDRLQDKVAAIGVLIRIRLWRARRMLSLLTA